MTPQPPEYYHAWTKEKFSEAHTRFTEHCASMRAMTRETIIDYGRALNAEILRREEVLSQAHKENDMQIEEFKEQLAGISKLLKFLPYLPNNE